MSKISKNSIKLLLAGLSCMAPLSASGADLQYQNIYYIPPGMHVSKVLPPKIENDDTYSQSYKQKDDSSIEEDDKYLRSSEKNEDSSEVKRVLYDSKNKKNSKKTNLIKYGACIGVGALCVAGGVAFVARAIQNNELDTLKKKKIDSFYEMQHNLNDGTNSSLRKKDLDSYYNNLLTKYSENSSMLYKINEMYEGRSYELLHSLETELQSTLDSLKTECKRKSLKDIENTYTDWKLSPSYEETHYEGNLILADFNYCGLTIPVLIQTTNKHSLSYNPGNVTDVASFLNPYYVTFSYENTLKHLFTTYLNKYLENRQLGLNDVKAKIEELCKLLCYNEPDLKMTKTNHTYSFSFHVGYKRELTLKINTYNQDQTKPGIWKVSE